jgi:hypothetical protein
MNKRAQRASGNRTVSVVATVMVLLGVLLSGLWTGTCRATPVSGLSTAPAAPNDVVMIIDVSDNTMGAAGTNKKTTVQGFLQGFPAGSISQVTLDPTMFGPGSVAGASLSPAILGPGTISGASLSPSILGPSAISGATLNISSGFLSGVSVSRSDTFRFNEALSGTSIYVINSNITLDQDQLSGRYCEVSGPTSWIIQLGPILTSVTPTFKLADTTISGDAGGVTLWNESGIVCGTGVSAANTGQTIFINSGNTGFAVELKAMSFGGTFKWRVFYVDTSINIRRP